MRANENDGLRESHKPQMNKPLRAGYSVSPMHLQTHQQNLASASNAILRFLETAKKATAKK